MFVCARRGEVVSPVVVHAEPGLGADQVRAAVSRFLQFVFHLFLSFVLFCCALLKRLCSFTVAFRSKPVYK